MFYSIYAFQNRERTQRNLQIAYTPTPRLNCRGVFFVFRRFLAQYRLFSVAGIDERNPAPDPLRRKLSGWVYLYTMILAYYYVLLSLLLLLLNKIKIMCNNTPVFCVIRAFI